MRASAAFLALSASISTVSAAVDISTVKRETSAPIVPGTYLVELSAPSNLSKRFSQSPHETLYRELNRRGAKWKLRKEFNTKELFIGASVKVGSDKDLLALAQVEHVKSISPVYLHSRPSPLKAHTPTGKNDPKLPPDTFSTHKMTGVDRLHAEGHFGKGVSIAVIDTGIDYLHPSLGGGYGPGFKVSHGHDFVGDAYSGLNEPVPDEDPLDCGGHGTHVSGIIGANLDTNYNFTGVAPEATLGGYRVFGCEGSVSDEVLVDALIRAYKDGNDVLSLSLGGAQGWTSAVTAVVASRIAEAGRIVAIAAGNDGAYGGFYSSSPGTGINVISVASVENTELVIQTAILNNGHPAVPYYSFTPLNIPGQLPLYAISADTLVADDACNPLPPTTPDLSKYLVLVKRGSCTFVTKIQNIQAYGAKYALIYKIRRGQFQHPPCLAYVIRTLAKSDAVALVTNFNVDNALSGISVGDFSAALISQADGKYLVEQSGQTSGVLISFPQSGASQTISNPTGGLMSSFSTYGPVNDLYFKPSLAAPGGNILSTYPRKLGSYQILSGTSMATPFLAGSAALLLEAAGKKRSTYYGARYLFETTAAAVQSSFTDGDPLQTLAQAGAGLINVYNAIHSTTIVTPGELLLNDTTYFDAKHTITIANLSPKPKTFTISHVPAGTATTFGDGQAVDYPVPLSKNYATVKFSKTSLVVLPGSSATFTATFTPPAGLDPTAFPVYSGFVKVTSANETLSVSYLGVDAPMKSMKVIDESPFYFDVPLPAILDGSGGIQTEPTVYTFQGEDWPLLLYRLTGGTPSIHFDLVSANTSINGTTRVTRSMETHAAVSARLVSIHKDAEFGAVRRNVVRPSGAVKRGLLDLVWSWLFPLQAQVGTFSKLPIVGELAEYEWLSRSSDGSLENNGYSTIALDTPTFTNGTIIPNGSYRLLLRAQKITGDAWKNEDYEAWLSPVINVAVPSALP